MDRNPAIDIAKTLGIALVVMGHISGEGEGGGLVYLRSFIYQFHVPLFFFLSGFCLKEQEAWKEFLTKKFRRLYVPFVAWNFIFLIINVIAHALNGEQPVLTNVLKHSVKILLGLSATPLGGATWFLITLLQASILFKCLLSISRRWLPYPGYATMLLSLAAAIAGMLIYLPYGLERALVALFFVCAGHLSRSINVKLRISRQNLIIVAISGLVVTGLISTVNQPDMAFHQYGNLLLYLISSMIGIISILALCALMSDSRHSTFLKEWGRKTIWILIGHFSAFKLVTLVQMLVLGLPWVTIFAHPCNFVGRGWSVVYFVAGFFFPILFSRICINRNRVH